MSFSPTLGKAKGRLPALSLVHCKIEKAYELKNSAIRGIKKHGAGISIDSLRKSQILYHS